MDAREQDFAARLSAAIHRRGLSLDRLSHHLTARGTPVSPSTLSLWKNGHTHPRSSSTAAVACLEQLLATGSRYLLDGLARPAAGGAEWWRTTVPREHVLPPAVAPIDTTCAAWGIDPQGSFRRLQVHDVTTIDHQRRTVAHSVRQVLTVGSDGGDRFVAGEYANLGTPRLQEVVPVAGVRLGRVARYPEVNLSVSELILDPLLPPGTTTMVEYDVLGVPQPQVADAGSTDYRERRLTQPVPAVTLEVRFHPECLPATVDLRASRRLVHPGALDEVAAVPLHPVAGRVQVSMRDTVAGAARISWVWPAGTG